MWPAAAFTGRNLTCLRGERLVFEALDFSLSSGGALVLAGPNGSGKSSLLRVMAGLLPALEGVLAWDGAELSPGAADHAERIHYLGHHDAVKPALTVRENLAFWGRLEGADRESLDNALGWMGLGGKADEPARYLSAGQRRRLAFARLLASLRPLWLLDEPSLALDREAVAALEEAVALHREAGGMVAAATHVELELPGADTLVLGAEPAEWRLVPGSPPAPGPAEPAEVPRARAAGGAA